MLYFRNSILSLSKISMYSIKIRKYNHNIINKNISTYIKSLINDKNINTIPNIITMSRIISSPLLSIAIAYDMKITALSGCIIFAFTDWLDGYLAKKLNQKTVLGAFLDPVADKILIGSLTIGLVVKGLLPISLAGIMIGRDITLIIASFILRAKEKPFGAHFFDTTNSATFNIVPNELSKVIYIYIYIIYTITLLLSFNL